MLKTVAAALMLAVFPIQHQQLPKKMVSFHCDPETKKCTMDLDDFHQLLRSHEGLRRAYETKSNCGVEV